MAFIQPKEYVCEEAGGTFILSKFPATVGREIMIKYPMYNAPKIFDWLKSEEVMLVAMRYVAKKLPDREIVLENKTLIDQHISPGGLSLARVEFAQLRYNFDFLDPGCAFNIWTILRTELEESAVRILTRFVDLSSQNTLQLSANLESTTPSKISK